jgi:hypothetical protein
MHDTFKGPGRTALALGLGAAFLVRPAVAKDTSYKAAVDVRAADAGQSAECESAIAAGRPCELRGAVFEDKNRDGRRQHGEPGVPGVLVSNGAEVVVTDAAGRYTLSIEERPGGTTIFITKPAGYDVPLNAQNIPQFSYHHVPQGSPPLRFGGLPASGPLPGHINFPVSRGRDFEKFKVVISGDTQPYSNTEVGYVRDTLARDMLAMGTDDIEFVMVEGDIVGDDLGLYPRFKDVMKVTDTPHYFVPGNHDLDFDANDDAFALDTFRREWGPAYYSFDLGQVHFVTLDDLRYPCTTEDNRDGRHAFCDNPGSLTYTGVVDDRQMLWLANDLAAVPEDKLIVLSMHIPLVSYVDQGSSQHQVSNVKEIYELLRGRKALALSGHTHTLEQFRPGELYQGWQTAFNEPIGPSPFPQIVTGATCGSWWSGDLDADGIPMAIDRLGAPRGYLVIEFDGASYRDTFKATGKAVDRQMSVSILSRSFTNWYDSLLGWLESDPATRSSITPVGIHDLPDTSIITDDDIAAGVFLVTNVWNGSKDSDVFVRFDNGALVPMVRTQQGDGEAASEFLDPYALERQMYVLRFAVRSTSGNPRAQGFELYRGSRNTSDPRPLEAGLLTTRSPHLWQARIPEGLGQGSHTARVVTVDQHGREFEDVIAFEVLPERPPAFFRSEVFE